MDRTSANQGTDQGGGEWAAGEPLSIPHSPFQPFDPRVSLYLAGHLSVAMPYEYTGWRDEQLSWKQSCYLSGMLNPLPSLRIKGPDALQFLSRTHVNGFGKFPLYSGKHGIMCDEAGRVITHGVLVRLAEDEFVFYGVNDYLKYRFNKDPYDAVMEDISGRGYMFQLAGPRSLEILERATGEDFHDLKFMGMRATGLGGLPFNVLRMGMGGSLAYEIHGRIEDAKAVYRALMAAGAQFGVKRLGFRAYMMNHTENGYPQSLFHFPLPFGEDPELAAFVRDDAVMAPIYLSPPLYGSMGKDIRLRYRNPVELGWQKTIKFDHDFIGRAALEKEVANPRRKMVTLEWNVDDILDIHRSQYEPGVHYMPIEEPNHPHFTGLFADRVLKNGKLVGVSSGRCYSYSYRRIISLCSIDAEYADLGNGVDIVWGDEGTRQKQIRATVTRFPYMSENRNQDVDLTHIPRLRKVAERA